MIFSGELCGSAGIFVDEASVAFLLERFAYDEGIFALVKLRVSLVLPCEDRIDSPCSEDCLLLLCNFELN